MKSAYELAMERLNRQAPAAKLSDAQKKQIAELDSQYAARIAQREIGLKSEMERASSAGNLEEADNLQQQLIAEKKKLQAELEEKKEQVRQAG